MCLSVKTKIFRCLRRRCFFFSHFSFSSSIFVAIYEFSGALRGFFREQLQCRPTVVCAEAGRPFPVGRGIEYFAIFHRRTPRVGSYFLLSVYPLQSPSIFRYSGRDLYPAMLPAVKPIIIESNARVNIRLWIARGFTDTFTQ